MHNTSKDHLHRLICSMTRAEKRYFKLYTSRHLVGNHSNHQVLFDAVAGMKEYDEQALLAKFKGEAFTRRFAIAKRRLYDMILRSLDAFHAESSIETKMRRSLHQVEILFKKGLYKDAGKILRSIRRNAVDRELDTLLIDVKLWERRLMERTNYVDLKNGEIEAAGKEMQELLSRIGTRGTLWELKSELFQTLYRKGRARDPHTLDELNGLMAHPAMESEPLDARGAYLFHHVKSAHAWATGDSGNCEKHLTRQLSILNERSELFKEEPHLALAVMSNLIHITLSRGDETKAMTLLARFKKLPEEMKMDMTEDLRMRMFATATSLELSMGIQKGRFTELVQRAAMITEELAQFESRLGTVRKAGLYYSLAYVHFATGNNNEAAKWINGLLNDIHIDKSEDIVCFSHLLNLLIHLENGKERLLPYAIRSSQRFLKTRKRVFRFETLFLELVKKLSKIKDKKEEAALLEEFSKACAELRGNPFESPVFAHFHPEAWAKGRIAGKTIEQMFTDSARNVQAA